MLLLFRVLAGVDGSPHIAQGKRGFLALSRLCFSQYAFDPLFLLFCVLAGVDGSPHIAQGKRGFLALLPPQCFWQYAFDPMLLLFRVLAGVDGSPHTEHGNNLQLGQYLTKAPNLGASKTCPQMPLIFFGLTPS